MSTDFDLPRLSGAELVARFGNDEAALRRYRILVALVREGRSPGEVARTFGVSRESLRRLRLAFAREGLAALHSRKRGGGHLARNSPLGEAIRRALEDDPSAPTALLWRRVQASLRAAGAQAPRSTFYRLLSQLRGTALSRGDSRAAQYLLRDALGALAEDPPLQLGRSDLAQIWLADIRDPLQRGRHLQRALRAAIERLRPAESVPVLDDPRWRHYLIVAGEYETGEKRTALQDLLALSASTYSRAKREALGRLTALLPVVLSELPPPGPPPALVAPPSLPTEFDRDAELELYTTVLRRDGLVVVWGAAADERRDMATMLAQRLSGRGQKVFWHTCDQPDGEHPGAIGLLRALAAALALDGHPEPWEQINASEPPGVPRQIDIVGAALGSRHWTFFVADVEHLADDESLRVMKLLLRAVERRDLRLVIVSRVLPEWAGTTRLPALPPGDDEAGRQAFIERLVGRAGSAFSQAIEPIEALPSLLRELLAVLPEGYLNELSGEQIEQVLAALQPLEGLIDRLRAIGASRRGAEPGTQP